MKLFKNLINKSLSNFNYQLVKIDKSSSTNFPIEIEPEIKKIINISNQFSMSGEKRMYVLSQAIINSKINNLEGDFVECGVWQGGNILLFKLISNYLGLNKNIYAFDTFDGMTLPDKFDEDYQGNSAAELMKKTEKKNNDKFNIHCFADLGLVKKNILQYSNLENIIFVKDPVEKSLLLEKNLPEKISVLRLDTDFYSSTKIELEILYPRLVTGGVLIIDDYGHWKGARKATDEFFDKKKWLHYVDQTCRYIIKT